MRTKLVTPSASLSVTSSATCWKKFFSSSSLSPLPLSYSSNSSFNYFSSSFFEFSTFASDFFIFDPLYEFFNSSFFEFLLFEFSPSFSPSFFELFLSTSSLSEFSLFPDYFDLLSAFSSPSTSFFSTSSSDPESAIIDNMIYRM